MVKLLRSMMHGELGTLLEVASSSMAAKRLADMGFIQGTEVQMLHTGNPCVVRVDDGASYGLGRPHQCDIKVQLH